jgi:hypothetical protein
VFVAGADDLVVGSREFWNQDSSEDSKQRGRGLRVVDWEKGGKEGVGGSNFVNGTLGMGIISGKWSHSNFATKDVEFDLVFGNKVGKVGDKFYIGQTNENGTELFLGIRERSALKSNWRCGGQRVYGIDGSWQGCTIVHFVGRKGHTVGGYV